jgi:membrane associated rhomboid family serine protease
VIIPYGHEHTTVRRLPWVTFVLMAACVAAFALTSLATRRDGTQVNKDFTEFFEYYSTHPYLEIQPEFARTLDRYVPHQEFQTFLEATRDLGAAPPTSPRQVAAEQEELDRIVERALASLAAIRDSSYRRFGVVPAAIKPSALITYQFLHGGFLHLFGNLFFLFLAGPFIEDVWGRPVFAAFYLTAGALSALMFALRYPELDEPLIGASGAVAGVMGAFLVRYWKTRIRFLYFFIPFRPGTFTAPAWLMLPLWFARELVFAQAWDVASPGTGGGGVAHWAHVWGFAFGLAVAAGIAYWRVEERFIHRAIEAKITVHDNPAVDRALEARAQGRLEHSLQLLAAVVRDDPGNTDGVLALWNAAVDSGRPEIAAGDLQRIIQAGLRADDETLVLQHWEELALAVPNLQVDPSLAARVVEILLRSGRRDAVGATLAHALRSVGAGTPIGPLVRLARTAVQAGAPAAASFAREALSRPDLPADVRPELAAIAAAAATPTAAAGPTGSPVARLGSPAVVHRLQVVAAVPQALEEDNLVIQVEGATRRLSLARIEAIAVGGVARSEKRPVVVVDLMLDAPGSDRRELRVVRLRSTDFDPRALAPGPDAAEAFRAFLGRIIELSGAAMLPDPDGARGRPFQTFASLPEYERAVLGVSVAGDPTDGAAEA